MTVHSYSRRLTTRISARLEPLGPAEHLDEPLYAINWFNTRTRLLYQIYTILAAYPVSRVQSRLWLKARHRSLLSGSERDQRSMLLIVRYPSGKHFLDLLTDKVFQIVSVLRNIAVKQFSFVLNRCIRVADLPTRPDGKALAVHHFQSDEPFADEIRKIDALLAGTDVSICMASQKAAEVVMDYADGSKNAVPFVTDKMIIFEASDFTSLETTLTRPSYCLFIEGLSSSYLSTLEWTG